MVPVVLPVATRAVPINSSFRVTIAKKSDHNPVDIHY